MFIDLTPPNEWLNLNRSIAQSLSFNQTQGSICIYKNLSHALQEICFGLTKLFPHKNKIYYFKNMNPYIDSLVRDLKLESHLNIKALDLKILKTPDLLFESFSPESLFLIYAKDDPLLGRVFETNSFVKTFNPKALTQKCFLISISHNTHLYEEINWKTDTHLEQSSKKSFHSLGPYNIDICSYGKKGALSFLGARSKKIESFLASKLSWNPKDYDEIKKFFPSQPEEKNKKRGSKKIKPSEAFEKRRLRILDFEKKRIGGFKRFFLENQPRTFDRAVFYWEDMDGYAFIELLSKNLGFSLLKPGDETRIETTSLTRWGGIQTMDWLKAFGLSENQIRGLILVNVSLINENLLNRVQQTRNQILSLQTGQTPLKLL